MTSSKYIYGFGLEEYMSNSSDTEEEKEVSTQSKTTIANQQITKFQALRQKRIRIKEKHERKLASRLVKNIKPTKHAELVQQSRAASSSSKPSQPVIEGRVHSNFNEDLDIKKIDLALANNDIQLAEQLSDNLSSKETNANLMDTIEAQKFELTLQQNKSQKKLKKSIPWRFEAKKRWETKSNM